jgi:VWFA-related protein
MTRALLAGVCLGASLMVPTAEQSQQPAVFRATGDAVFVDVSIMDRRHPVAGLTSADFVLTDSGVPQVVRDVRVGAIPLDVVLLLDTSQSFREILSGRLTEAVTGTQVLLHDGDRFDLLGFDSVVRRVARAGDLLTPASSDRRHTALWDALAAALLLRADPGHRRLIVTLTDGVDTNSYLNYGMVAALTDRSEAPVHAIVLTAGMSPWMDLLQGTGRTSVNSYTWWLTDICNRSGGAYVEITPTADFMPEIAAAIEGMRTHYTLAFVPEGVAAGGWHELTVRLTRGKYQVRARKGYYRK